MASERFDGVKARLLDSFGDILEGVQVLIRETFRSCVRRVEEHLALGAGLHHVLKL